MELVRLETSETGEALRRSTAILASCGYEARSAAITPRLDENVRHRVALAFHEYSTTPRRTENERVFRAAGFRLETASGASGDVAQTVVQSLFDFALDDSGEVTIDISSMTRVWYAAAIRHLRSRKSMRPLVVNFLYFPGKYKPDLLQGTPNEVVGPVPGFCSLDAPEQPTALVLGLGFDAERARGLQELLEPKRTVFLKVGAGFRPLGAVPEEWKGPSLGDAWRDAIEYPLQDPLTTFQLSESIARGLSAEHRVVLVSLGPKMLGLLFILIGMQWPDVSVWRVSSGASQPPTDTEAQKHAVVCRTVWQ